MKIYKITEASEYLGVSINTLKTLANNGRINSFKTFGGHRHFRQDDLDAYMGVEKEKQEKWNLKRRKNMSPTIITPKGPAGSPVQPDALMALDVATKYTGYAVFLKDRLTPPLFGLTHYGILKASGKEWEERCYSLSRKFATLIRDIKPGCLLIEFPSFQAGKKGMAASRSGGTLQLAYLCGRFTVQWELYCTKVLVDAGIRFYPTHMVTYSKWNGQLPKEVTCKRCATFFEIEIENPRSIENNFVDAIMMGKWFIENEMKMRFCTGHAGAERKDY